MTAKAMAKLHTTLPGGLTAASVMQASREELIECIKTVGFYNRKAEYIKDAAQVCHNEHAGDIPRTAKDLMKLKGVGPKMAYLAMQSAWNVNAGIGVDTHVHRVTNRLGWVRTKDPEATRLALQDWLPPEHWRQINHLLVGFGQTTCQPRTPLCAHCPVSDTCPSSSVKKRVKREATSAVAKKEPSSVTVEGEPSSKVVIKSEVDLHNETNERAMFIFFFIILDC